MKRILRIVMIAGMLLWPVYSGVAGVGPAATPDSSMEEYLRNALPLVAGVTSGRESVVIVFDFLRFGCVPCLNAFLDLCDTLRSPGVLTSPVNIVLFIRRDKESKHEQERRMRSWLRSSGADLPFRFVEAERYERFGIADVALLLFDRSRVFDAFVPLPKTGEERTFLIKRIERLKESVAR